MDFFKDIKPLTKVSENEPIASNNKYIPPINTEEFKDLIVEGKSSPYKGIWVFAALSIVILFFVSSSFFSKAYISISLKPKITQITETLLLKKDSSSLPFETIEVSTEIKKEIIFTKQEKKQEKALGKIIITNLYSDKSQKLIKNTRFESSDGFIFRLKEDVLVPGFQTIETQKIPGTLEVEVVADEIGELYNIKKDLPLTIPGFKNSPQFSLLYAKTSNQFTGGADGMYYISENLGDTFNSEEKKLLEKKLKELVHKQIPEETFIYIPSLAQIDVFNESIAYSKEPKMLLEIKGTLKQIVFPKKSFFEYLLRTHSEIKDRQIKDTSELSGTVISFVPFENNYTVQISGIVKSYGTINELGFKEKLAGFKKSIFNKILSEHFSEDIVNADLVIKPFWIKKIPSTFNRINIKYVDDK